MNGGTKFDNGKADLSLLPPPGLYGAARVFEFGAKKYGRYNFTKGFTASRLIAASLRHITAWAWGEDLDSESGESHVHHAICCLLMLCQIKELGTLTDDRFKPPSHVEIPIDKLKKVE